MRFFQNIPTIKYRYYDPKKKVLGKTMEEQLRIAICFWHTFCWEGNDMFGLPTFHRPWLRTPADKIRAGFEFLEKMGLKYFTFHDVDVAPGRVPLKKMADLMAKEMQKTKTELLWGTANLTGHPRYLAGAATNPDPDVFAYAVRQVKAALDTTHQLGGHNYVLWGGREGYETLLNTDMKQELDQYGKFLSLLVEYKHKIGFKGFLLIEPKPCEPLKHMYDFDCANAFAFLQKYGLEREFKFNIETNHATLAGHTLAHEISYAIAHNVFGSLDANEGDLLLGWDTDQFPLDVTEYTHALYLIIKNGGFTSGGLNLDAKVRRQSIELSDLFFAHINGVDTLARALLEAEKLIKKGRLEKFIKERYKGWETHFGKEILQGKMSFEAIAKHAEKHSLNPKPKSGRQEFLEGVLRDVL
ncbi:MAG TPA: xylose isomerase [Rhabdochlamydiaceae bacterium]|jgi:xylose isomerase